ncbi:MAG: hypothetical protein M3Y28_01810 [Armatimonadota bacterium]|nr:hypothetical protein [Armatimonadota bacterium]
MSAIYVRRLDRVREEYVAASGALAYVSAHWHSQSIFSFRGLASINSEDVRRAANDLEATYFIRLFSVFEGILKEHLAKNHPSVRVAEDASAAWLIDRVSARQRPPIIDPLRSRVHAVRRYRNFLVHPGGLMPAFVPFSEALGRRTRFSDRLPDAPY